MEVRWVVSMCALRQPVVDVVLDEGTRKELGVARDAERARILHSFDHECVARLVGRDCTIAPGDGGGHGVAPSAKSFFGENL